MKSVFSLICLITIVNARACCRGNFGSPINQVDWTQYVTNVKNQGSADTCWAHATTSFLEIQANKLLDIPFKLSVQQLVDNTYKEDIWGAIGGIYCQVREETSGGGWGSCALQYIKARGIMTERDYIMNGYDIRKVLPIGISSISISQNLNSVDKLLTLLNVTPLLLTINGDKLTDYEYNIDTSSTVNHLVVGTNLCQYNNHLFVEYLNSYSTAWGGCGGYGYIRVTDDNHNIVNNRKVLGYVSYAELSSLRSIISESCSDKIDSVFKMEISILVFLTTVFAMFGITTCYLVYLTKVQTHAQT